MKKIIYITILLFGYLANSQATRIFWHDMEGTMSVVPNKTYSGYSAIVGTSPNTGGNFETLTYNGGAFYGIHHVINGGSYFENAANDFVTINDRDGNPTQCLRQRIFDWPDSRSVTQSTIQINNITTSPTDGLYVRMWMKIPFSDIPDNYDWRVLGGYKTADHDGGGLGTRLAFRYGKAGSAQQVPSSNVYEGDYFTSITVDDGPANNTTANWSYTSSTALPPQNDTDWFLMEYYIELGNDGNNGTAWLKINGELVGSHTGQLTIDNDEMKYLFLTQMYGGNWDSTGATTNTHYQYLDDVQIWRGGVPTADQLGEGAGNHAPTDIVFSSTNTNTIHFPENTVNPTVSLSTLDADSGDTHTYSKTGGGYDAANFSIIGSDLTLNLTPDYETPSDLGSTNNVYAVEIRTDDGNGGTFDKMMLITIDDIVEGTEPVNLASFGGGNRIKVGNNAAKLRIK